MKKRIIKYGGVVTGIEEERAIIRSIRNSRKTRNWQEAEEGKLFSEEAARFLGIKYGILANSGSSAGLLALSSLELPKGAEVIISAVTFPTIFNIILQCGLVPVVVDAKVGTYGFDIKDVEKSITEKTRAIIAIHPLGNPIDIFALMELVNDPSRSGNNKIWVISDNCDGFGTTINDKSVDSYADVSITSWHAAHIISCGVGGAVFTNNKELAKKVKMYRDWGRQADINRNENRKHKLLPPDHNSRFIYEKIGYNFQVLELQAAMGRIQLRKIKKIKEARKKNFDYLFEHLAEYSVENKGSLILPKQNTKADVCWFAFPLTYAGDRSKILKYLERNGIETRPLFSGNITRHPAYDKSNYRISGKLTDADYITKHSFWISCHSSLTQSDLKYMVKIFNKFFNGKN